MKQRWIEKYFETIIDDAIDSNGRKRQCLICHRNYVYESSWLVLRKHISRHGIIDEKNIYNDDKTDLIVKFIVNGNHSFNVVEQEYFVKMLKKFDPKYQCINRLSVSRMVLAATENLLPIIKKNLSEASDIALTFDAWT